MKNSFLIACAAALLSACSGPSYYLMSAKTGAYHGENSKVAAAPVVAQPDDYAPLEASTNPVPVALPPVSHQAPARASVPVSSPGLPLPAQTPAPASHNVPAETSAPVILKQKAARKLSPKKLQKLQTSNTRLALIFLIVGAIVALLLHFVIGILLVIAGIVLLIA